MQGLLAEQKFPKDKNFAMTSIRMRHLKHSVFLCGLGLGFVVTQGCGAASVQDKVLHKNSTDPVDIAANLLESYAVGQPIGSEAEGYEEIISGVISVDATKGDELKKFLDSIDRTRRVDRKEAKRLLELFRPEP